MTPPDSMATVAAPPDTKEALLAAAERLFAERGVDRTSLRAITEAAAANLASVNYHFGSKRELVRSVLARRLGPLNRERLRRLEAVLAQSGAPEPEAVVRAFIGPALEMVRHEPGGHAFARFVMRAFTAPGIELRSAVLEQFGEVVERFTAALERALPHLREEEVQWRFHFMVGSMVHTLGLGPRDLEEVSGRLVRFLGGGLRAPGEPAAVEGAR